LVFIIIVALIATGLFPLAGKVSSESPRRSFFPEFGSFTFSVTKKKRKQKFADPILHF